MTDSVHTVCPHCSAVNRIPMDRPPSDAARGACKAKLFTGEPIALTAKTFDKHVERNDMPLIVDFWAPLVWAVPHDGASSTRRRRSWSRALASPRSMSMRSRRLRPGSGSAIFRL
jgi:hypothetical protein